MTKVYHCPTADNWKKRNQIEYWENNSLLPLPTKCLDCGCTPTYINDLVGAHVRKEYGNNHVYIVPTCRRCNSAGAQDNHSFYVNENYLVPLN